MENGWPWPPRMAAESFISYGVFNPGETAEAFARLNGVVQTAEVRTVTLPARRFIAARVSCAGFEVDVCLPADDQTVAPAAGSVIAGRVFLVASMPELPLPMPARPRRSWLPWRR